jgi:hypothetical protein
MAWLTLGLLDWRRPIDRGWRRKIKIASLAFLFLLLQVGSPNITLWSDFALNVFFTELLAVVGYFWFYKNPD